MHIIRSIVVCRWMRKWYASTSGGWSNCLLAAEGKVAWNPFSFVRYPRSLKDAPRQEKASSFTLDLHALPHREKKAL